MGTASHHGRARRGARHGAAGHARRFPAVHADRLRAAEASGAARGGAGRRSDPPVADHHAEVGRERAARAARDRRLDQRHRPPDRHRRARRREDRPEPAERALRLDAGAGRPEADRPVLHGGPLRRRRRRRGAARTEAAAAPRLHDGDRRDAGRAPGARGGRLGRPRRGAAARRSRSRRRAAWWRCSARSRPTARSSSARRPTPTCSSARAGRWCSPRSTISRRASTIPRSTSTPDDFMVLQNAGPEVRLRHARGGLPADPAEARARGREGHGAHLGRAHERHRLRHHRAARVAGGGGRRAARAGAQRRPHPAVGEGAEDRPAGA